MGRAEGAQMTNSDFHRSAGSGDDFLAPQTNLFDEMFERFLAGKDQQFFLDYDEATRMSLFESEINSLSPFELLQKISQTLERLS
jgi:hypothetical protein